MGVRPRSSRRGQRNRVQFRGDPGKIRRREGGCARDLTPLLRITAHLIEAEVYLSKRETKQQSRGYHGLSSEPQIVVCALAEMSRHVCRLRPGRLVSLLPAEEQPPTPPLVHPSDHLRLHINDYNNPSDGPNAPTRHHIETLTRFLFATPTKASILIHCLAGVSRSPAAALIAMVLEAPEREHEAALHLRRIAPFVMPNRLMIELADDVLGRTGALVAALDAMGPPDWLYENRSFVLPRSFAGRDLEPGAAADTP